MKLEHTLSRLAAAGFIATLIGVLTNAFAVGLFAAAIGLFIALLVTSDYARPPRSAALLIARQRREIHPLAA